jgi:hypothetical protein
MKKMLLGLMTATALVAGTFATTVIASAAEGEPALLIDLGGKFDKSFNEAAWTGAEKWKAESGKSYMEFELQPTSANRPCAILLNRAPTQSLLLASAMLMPLPNWPLNFQTSLS